MLNISLSADYTSIVLVIVAIVVREFTKIALANHARINQDSASVGIVVSGFSTIIGVITVWFLVELVHFHIGRATIASLSFYPIVILCFAILGRHSKNIRKRFRSKDFYDKSGNKYFYLFFVCFLLLSALSFANNDYIASGEYIISTLVLILTFLMLNKRRAVENWLPKKF